MPRMYFDNIVISYVEIGGRHCATKTWELSKQ